MGSAEHLQALGYCGDLIPIRIGFWGFLIVSYSIVSPKALF